MANFDAFPTFRRCFCGMTMYATGRTAYNGGYLLNEYSCGMHSGYGK